MTDKLLTTKEVADMLRLTENVLSIWRHRGEGPKYFKISRRAVRYRESDIQDWMQLLAVEPPYHIEAAA